MEDFFIKMLNLFLIKCEKLSLLFIDFGLKHCIKTETFENSITVNYHQFIVGSNNVLFFNIANITLISL